RRRRAPRRRPRPGSGRSVMPNVHAARVLRRLLGPGLVVCLALLPATLFAQAVPKLPSELPVPKSAPKTSDPEVARPLQPAQSAEPAPASQPAWPAPSGPAPAGPRPDGRDPFDPLITRAPEGENRPSLSGLRLVGVMWDPARKEQVRALVETPDGLGYYVRL